MRALVINGPGEGGIVEVEPPISRPGEAIIEVAMAGICGTDVELFDGSMAYLHDGNARYPLRIGHEWSGRVLSVGDTADSAWVGVRVTGDTMLGCGDCDRCQSGRHHVCALRYEVGVRGGWPGALAELISMPVSALHELPESVDDIAAAMIEPAGNAWRAFDACRVAPGERLLVLGPGTIGLLCAMFARAAGVEVHLLGREGRSLEFARTLGFDGTWTEEDMPQLRWHGVIDASSAAAFPARALALVEPGRTVALVGLAGSPSMIDTRASALKDVTLVGILGASAGLAPSIEAFAAGVVDPRPLVAEIVRLDDATDVLSAQRKRNALWGPKTLIDVNQRSLT